MSGGEKRDRGREALLKKRGRGTAQKKKRKSLYRGAVRNPFPGHGKKGKDGSPGRKEEAETLHWLGKKDVIYPLRRQGR